MFIPQDVTQRPWTIPVAILVILLLSRRVLNRLAYTRKASANGCAPAPSYPHSDGRLGIQHLLKIAKAKKEDRLPEIFCSIFDDRSPDTHTIAHYMLGKKSYWTREPENIKALLSSNFKDWGLPAARINAFSSCWGGGIFGADGQHWEHSRALLRPAFNRSQIQDTELLERHVGHLISRITDGQTTDLADLFPMFATDVGTDMLFGEGAGCLDPAKSDEGKHFASCFDNIMQQMSLQLSMPILANIPSGKLKKSVKFIFDFTDSFIDRALKLRLGGHEDKREMHDEKRGKHCFLDQLAKDYDSPQNLRGELLSIMVAGRDTTASLLSILWWHLARRPDIVQKLREELAPLRSEAPSPAELKNLKYLNQVINEVLRLYPINPINSRTARCDTTLPRGGGPDGRSPVFIDKGETVIFSSLALHRRPDIWGDDALEFKPERWEAMRPSNWTYIPFGGGPRICLGQQLAQLETEYTTARLLQEFPHIEPRSEGPFVQKFAMALTSGDGCKIMLSRHAR